VNDLHRLFVTLTLAFGAMLAATAPAGAAETLSLKSNAALVVDQDTGESLFAKNADVVMPIASLTKLMTALVVTDARLPMDEMLEISNDDVDREKHTTSRLPVGTRLSRGEMMLLALMASENRAAMALSRGYPGGRKAFLSQMNEKARSLGMSKTYFADSAGLSSLTVSTARDLLRLVAAADAQEQIRKDTVQPEATMRIRKQTLTFVNTNRMVRNNRDWDIELQKTGFTNEAGRCLVMRATTLNRNITMVFLNSFGTLTRFADAGRVRKHLERQGKAKPARPATEAANTTKAAS
jgi:D-alanyl-D-alanine endopeptidase (penicillin-binding protein 7)